MLQGFIAGLRECRSLFWVDAGPFVRRRVAGIVLLVIVAAIVTALGPIALERVIDSFAASAGGRSGAPLTLILLFVLSQFLVRGVGGVRAVVFAGASRRMLRLLSGRLFAHVMRLPLRFHLERQTGAVSQTLADGLQGYQTILTCVLLTLLPVTAELGTVILILARLTLPVLVALFCGALACYGAVFIHAAVTIAPAAKAASGANVRAFAAMTDGLLNYETVKYFAAEQRVEASVERAFSQSEAQFLRFSLRYAVNDLYVAGIFTAFIAATTLYAAGAVQVGRMTVGDFVLVNTYMLQMVRPVEAVGNALQGVSQGWAMLQKLLEIFRQAPETEPLEPGESATMVAMGTAPAAMAERAALGRGAVEFERVSLSYSPPHSVLENLSFRIPAGRTLGVVGGSGSGKSTTVRLLVRLLEPDSGRILLDGVPIGDLSLAQLRGSIAVVPQDTVLFNDTIGYNIAFGKPDATMDEVERAARLADLHDFIEGLPDQYATRVGERGVKLSGGEKQRISIARAVIRQPLIYVFDEATSSLDSRTERQILRNLRQISRGSTTLIIAHRLSSVVHADEIVVLDAGGIVERGSHQALVGNQGLYATLWNAQYSGSCTALPSV